MPRDIVYLKFYAQHDSHTLRPCGSGQHASRSIPLSTKIGTTQDRFSGKGVPTLAVVGGGLAGIAAAESAARQGCRVTLFERSRVLGGRAASLFDPVAGQWIDNGQHLALGCCSELLGLHRRLGLERFFESHRTIPFAQVGGKSWVLSPNKLLPTSLQLLPSLLRTPFLTFRERWQLVGQLRKLCAAPVEPDEKSFASWLAEQKSPQKAIDHFWTPLVFSALSETLDHVCCQAVRKVIQDGFLAGHQAMAVQLPTVPLRCIYNDAALERLRGLGVNVRLLSRVRRFDWDMLPAPEYDDAEHSETSIPRITALETADGFRHAFDAFIFALPAFRLWEILDASQLECYVEQLGLDRFEPGAITTLHLWFDRRVLPSGQAFATLLGGPGQFLTCHAVPSTESRAEPKNPGMEQGESTMSLDGFYHTVVVSAAHRLLSDGELTAAGSAPLLDRVLSQLKSTFPASFSEAGQSGSARLLHQRITTYFDAVFSPNAEAYPNRPEQETPFSNLALAGDWTQTHWPATMEGAVRSGLKAVEALAGKADPS